MNVVEQSNSIAFQDRLSRYAAKIVAEASALKPGSRRDELLRKVVEANNTIKIERWLSSPGLRAPI